MGIKKLIKFGIIGLVVLLGLVYLAVPHVREAVAWRVDAVRIRIQYAMNPPEEAVFVPNTPAATKAVPTATLTPTASQPQDTATPTPTYVFTPTPTITSTQLPEKAFIEDVPYIHQHGYRNYCGPANLTMPLKYWGWEGEREDIGPIIKPYEKDYNVGPSDMIKFIVDHTDLNIIVRQGGTPELLERLLANGFPVLIEKGVYFLENLTGQTSWMGHYNVVIGYDETKQELIIHDSFLDDGDTRIFSYEEVMEQWIPFNYIFLVVYPPDYEEQLFAALGDYVDPEESNRVALQIAESGIATEQGNEKYFALFNKGTSFTNLNDYNGAAIAYDEAFMYYATLPEEGRPWRTMWYQFGPYKAYYYTSRYQDVIDLATQTLDTASNPVLEESYYWRAMAKVKMGDNDSAIKDLRQSLKYHPGFEPSLELLSYLGVTP